MSWPESLNTMPECHGKQQRKEHGGYCSMKRNYAALLKAGAAAQLEKLRENAHKPGFADLDWKTVISGLNEEFYELLVAFDYLTKLKQETEPEEYRQRVHEARREAADVANYAHMFILRCDRVLEEDAEQAEHDSVITQEEKNVCERVI